jgi:hypothetical protein
MTAAEEILSVVRARIDADTTSAGILARQRGCRACREPSEQECGFMAS